VSLSIDEGYYHAPERLISDSHKGLSVQEAVLIRASMALGDLHETAELADHLLDLVLQAVPGAERAALVLHDRTGEERIRIRRPGNQGASAKEELSRTVVQRVLNDRVALVIEDLEPDDGLPKSLLSQDIKTFVGVPLLDLSSRAFGLLYLDSTSQPAEATRSQLEFLTAYAGLCASGLLNVMQFERLEAERQRLHNIEISSEIVGESDAMIEVKDLIERVAARDVTVLLLGESGTGKEVAAKAIHRGSDRSGQPFVAINCAALPESLLESELFGYEKGAFSGANRQKKGRIEAAENGTLFLDEIGEMSPGLQAKLLRVLEERTFERVGGNRTIPVDIRVLAATHRDLPAEIAAGTFREDLYYRLNVVSITMPPLRDRDADIMLLADHLRARLAARTGQTVAGFTNLARQALEAYRWPGNVRELSNAIERSLVLCDGDHIDVHDLPKELGEQPALSHPGGSYQEQLNETKKRLIIDAILASDGVYTEAAKRLDLHPNYLHRLIRNLELKEEIEKRIAL
jgi:Nif-specific regulatory protein